MNKELDLSFKILNNVYSSGAYASIELNKNYDEQLNFNLVTKIVYGVMDWDIKLGYFISLFYSKAPKSQVKLLLKMAAYVSMEVDSIPKFALVNELVEIAKHSKLKPYTSFINAVLKKMVNSEFVLPDTSNKQKYLSVKHSKPEWFIDLLLKTLSYEDAIKYLSHELPTSTHIRINTLKTDIDSFKSELDNKEIEYKPSVFEDCLYVDYSKLVRKRSLTGLYTPQGIPSMIVAKNVVGQSVLDACSAPGGKAVYFATLNPNSNIIACDIHSHRVKLIEEYKNNMGVTNLETKCMDASEFDPEFENKFDCVLLDVPCSGLGVVNKKPDILLKDKPDIGSIASLQYKILENNAKYVKVGGSIVYSTCTITKEENENIINTFLNNHANFKLDTVDTFNVDAVNVCGLKTFYPHVSNTEGFFIGKLKRYE